MTAPTQTPVSSNSRNRALAAKSETRIGVLTPLGSPNLIEISQSAEILCRDLRSHGFQAALNDKDAEIEIHISDRSLETGNVEIHFVELGRSRSVGLENAVDLIRDWLSEAGSDTTNEDANENE